MSSTKKLTSYKDTDILTNVKKIVDCNKNLQCINFIDQLNTYLPNNDIEIKNKSEMLKFLQNDNCFNRSNLTEHFTASAWIINEDNTKALTTIHKKLNMQLQLGGHCDGDNNVLRVAITESIEESGITKISYSVEIFDLDIHIIPEYNGIPEHKHYDVRYLIKVPNDSNLIINDEESSDLIWITMDDKLNYSTIGFERMFNKWLSIDISQYEFIKLF